MKKILAMMLTMMLVLSCTGAMAEWLYATDGDTNIRADADINARSIGTFQKGEKIWVFEHVYTSDGRNWCGVCFKGKLGFISDRYSSYEVSRPSQYRDVNNGRYGEDYDGYVYYDYEDYDDYEDYEDYDMVFDCAEEFEFEVTRNTKVRAWAGTDATVVGSLGRGSIVWGYLLFTSDSGEAWLEIEWEDGYAYVPAKVLRLTEPLYDGSYPRLGRKMRVTGGRVNVREDANINSHDLGTLHEGDVVEVDFFVCVEDGERRIWAHCYTDDGEEGFISCMYLTATR